MTARKSSNPRYAGERVTHLGSVSGLHVRFVEWYNPKVGRKTAVACAFQVNVDGEWRAISGYDSDHGDFHRHEAAWPEAGARDHSFGAIPMRERGAIALEDVEKNITQWVKKIPGRRLEE